MFAYEPVDEKWLSILQGIKKPMADGRKEPDSHWYADNAKKEAIYYVGWVSSSINRSFEDGPDNKYDEYRFAFIVDDNLYNVYSTIFDHPYDEWNEKNHIIVTTEMNNKIVRVDGSEYMNLVEDIKEAIIHYLNNYTYDKYGDKYGFKRKNKEVSMNNCTLCGGTINQGERFCQNCGNPLNAGQQPGIERQALQNESPTEQSTGGTPAQPQSNSEIPQYNTYYQSYTPGQNVSYPPGQNVSYPPGQNVPPAGNPAPKKKSIAVPILIGCGSVVLLFIIGIVVLAIIGAVVSGNEQSYQSGSTYDYDIDSSSQEEQSGLRRSGESEEEEPDDAEAEALIGYLNESFSLAAEYNYLGIAYFLDDENAPRDAYIPYGDDTEFYPRKVYSKNHGVSISTYLTREYADAKEALSNLNTGTIPIGEAMDDIEYYDAGGGTADNDTVGVRFYAVSGTLADGSRGIYVRALYADIRDDGYYMISAITLYGPEYDGETPLLIEEVNDCFGLQLPTDKEGLSVYAER